LEPLERLELLEPFPSKQFEQFERFDAVSAEAYPPVGKEWGWQWVFPATSHFIDRVTSEQRRHHLHESVLQRAFREARLKSGYLSMLAATRCVIHSPRTY
jgi:hypothetical protein